MLQWLKCLFGRHLVDQDAVISEMGAVFHADICKVCLKPWIGKFICNEWDDAQTEEVGGVCHLKGTNPILLAKKYQLIGDESCLHHASEICKARRKRGERMPWEK